MKHEEHQSTFLKRHLEVTSIFEVNTTLLPSTQTRAARLPLAPPAAPTDAVPPAPNQAAPAPQDPNTPPPAANPNQSADPMAKDGALPADAPMPQAQ